jgi:hypothetical protein
MHDPTSGSQTSLAQSALEPQVRQVSVIWSQMGSVLGQSEPVMHTTQVLLEVSQNGVGVLQSVFLVHAVWVHVLLVHTNPDSHDLGVLTPNGSQSLVEVQQNSGLGFVHAANSTQQTLKKSRWCISTHPETLEHSARFGRVGLRLRQTVLALM